MCNRKRTVAQDQATGLTHVLVSMAVVVQMEQLATSLVTTGGCNGGRLGTGSYCDILDRLDNDDLVDHVAVGNIVGADCLVACRDRRI